MPYSTVNNIFKRGIMGVSIQVVLEICSALNIDVEKIKDDVLVYKSNVLTNTLAQDENNLITNYRKLNETGKAKVKEYVEDLTCNEKYTCEEYSAKESHGA